MKALEKIIRLNSIIQLNVKNNEIHIQQYEEVIKEPLQKNVTLPDIKGILEPFSGKRACIINSDILGIDNQKIKFKHLEKHILQRVLITILSNAIPYLALIAKKEDSSIIIQNSYDSDHSALTIMAGLEDDLQVLLFDIHYERHERVIPC